MQPQDHKKRENSAMSALLQLQQEGLRCIKLPNSAHGSIMQANRQQEPVPSSYSTPIKKLVGLESPKQPAVQPIEENKGIPTSNVQPIEKAWSEEIGFACKPPVTMSSKPSKEKLPFSLGNRVEEAVQKTPNSTFKEGIELLLKPIKFGKSFIKDTKPQLDSRPPASMIKQPVEKSDNTVPKLPNEQHEKH